VQTLFFTLVLLNETIEPGQFLSWAVRMPPPSSRVVRLLRNGAGEVLP
jgi:hypothetical protein